MPTVAARPGGRGSPPTGHSAARVDRVDPSSQAWMLFRCKSQPGSPTGGAPPDLTQRLPTMTDRAQRLAVLDRVFTTLRHRDDVVRLRRRTHATHLADRGPGDDRPTQRRGKATAQTRPRPGAAATGCHHGEGEGVVVDRGEDIRTPPGLANAPTQHDGTAAGVGEGVAVGRSTPGGGPCHRGRWRPTGGGTQSDTGGLLRWRSGIEDDPEQDDECPADSEDDRAGRGTRQLILTYAGVLRESAGVAQFEVEPTRNLGGALRRLCWSFEEVPSSGSNDCR
jgi:hypothetical protein